MLIFTKFKNSFFQEAIFSNYFQIFKWIAREPLLHRVVSIHEEAGRHSNKYTANRGDWNNLNPMLFQRHDTETTLTNVTSTPCLKGNCLET